MADDLKISEMQELLTGGLHDDLIFEVVDLTELDVADQNKKVKLVTLEAALGAEDKIFKGTTNVTTLANSITSDIAGSERQNADLNQWLIGDAAGAHIVIDWDTGQVTLHDTSGAATFTHNDSGITLKAGATVDTIETTLTDDDTHVPSSGAVVDALVADVKDIISEGDTSVEAIDIAGGQVVVTVDATQEADFTAAGFKLKAGSRVNEIEAALTNDATHIPDSAAVFAALHPADKIEEGNSSVEVTDAGTGQVDTTVDTVLILRALVDRYQIPIGLLETNTAAPIDLTVDCGTEKTIKLAQPVWRDLNSSGAQLAGPGVVQPDQVKFLDEAGADTGIYTLGFDIGEKAHSAFEIPHDYVEGSDFSFHIHWQGITAPSGTDNVQWELTYTISRDGETLDAVTVIQTPDTPFDTQYDFVRSTFAVIDGATGGPNGGSIVIGDQFIFTLERVTATGDAYAGDALVSTAGIHYLVDTLGSRQIGTK